MKRAAGVVAECGEGRVCHSLNRVGQTHARKASLEPRVFAKRVPLRCDREIHEARIAALDGALEMRDRGVEIAELAVKERELDVGQRRGLACGLLEGEAHDARAAMFGVDAPQRLQGLGRQPCAAACLRFSAMWRSKSPSFQ